MNRAAPALALLLALAGCAATVNPVDDPKPLPPPVERGKTFSGAERPPHSPEALAACEDAGFVDADCCLREQAKLERQRLTDAPDAFVLQGWAGESHPAPRATDDADDKKVLRRIARSVESLESKVDGLGICASTATCESLGCGSGPAPDLNALCPAAGWVRPCPSGTACRAECQDRPEPPVTVPADWPAWWAVLTAPAKGGVQIARPAPTQKPYQGAEWAVNDHDVYGLGGSISAAFEDYRKKGGKFWNPAPAPAPTFAQRSALAKFLTLERKPTSLRRAGDGLYYCDYFRSQQLHDKTAGHATPEGAIAELVRVLGAEF